MAPTVESTDRRSADYLCFGLTFLGSIIFAAGVVMLSRGTAICGLVLVVFGIARFLSRDNSE